MIILRPDQSALKQGIYDGWNAGHRNVCGVLPTGGGKSIIVTDIVLDKYRLGASQTVIAHRNELVSQMSLHVAERQIPHRIIGPPQMIAQITAQHRQEFGQSFINPKALTSVAGVDTIVSRIADLEKWGLQQDFWTVDEGHHLLRDNKWGRAVGLFTNAYGLTVTASPQRADGKGLGRHADGLIDHMVVGPSARELMDIGAITDYEYVCPASDFAIDDDAITDSGDFSPVKMRDASKKSRIVGDVVVNWCKFALGKRAIVFATDVETATDIANRFKMFGITAEAVSAQTPSATRNEYVRRFRDGRITILVNVDLFGEGFDVPACECVILARPTASLAVYLQQCGRALRTMPGKLFGLIIDHVSNYKRHGYPDRKRYWTLDRRDKRASKPKDPEEIPLTVCKNCSRPYERVLFACPRCGTVPAVMPRASIEQVDGDLMLLDRDKLAELRAKMDLETPGAIAIRVGSAAGHAAGKHAANNQIERIAMQQRLETAIQYWAATQRAQGRDDQQTYRRFFLTLGVDVYSALALPRADMEKLADTVEGWMR